MYQSLLRIDFFVALWGVLELSAVWYQPICDLVRSTFEEDCVETLERKTRSALTVPLTITLDRTTTMSQAEEEEKEGELSLEDLKISSPLSSFEANSNSRTTSQDNDAAAIKLLSDCFGVNGLSGTCIRHVTCPVITGLIGINSDGRGDTSNSAHEETKSKCIKIVSCRVCYTEEKSVGIRQYPTFAAVMTQLKSFAAGSDASSNNNNNNSQLNEVLQASSSVLLLGSNSSFDHNSAAAHNSLASLSSPSTAENSGVALPSPAGATPASFQVSNKTIVTDTNHYDVSTRVLVFLQQPGAMESCLKRLNQVQNWMLRSREKDLLVQQLQIRNLEQRLSDALGLNEELKGTVKQLRRTIQQDLKVIKTMATQQMEDEMVASLQQQFYQDEEHSPSKCSPAVKRAFGSPAMSTAALPYMSAPITASNRFSPVKRPTHRAVSIPEDEEQENETETGAQTEQQMASATASTTTPGGSDMHEVLDSGGGGRSSSSNNSRYWNNESLKSSKIFQSFRGGLLDIPKSPPAARHDRENGDNNNINNPQRKKLQLNTAAMDALKLPSRALSRSNSSAPPVAANTNTSSGNAMALMMINNNNSKSAQTEISLDLIAAKLSLLPEKHQQLKLDGQSPEQFYPQAIPSLDAPKMPMAPLTTNDDDESHVHVDGTVSIVNILDNVEIPSLSETNSEKIDVRPDLPADQTPASDAHQGQHVAGPIHVSDLVASTGDDDPTDMEATPGATGTSTGSEKFVFYVTNASCHDKFGDVGTYTGNILVTEGLPHGAGKMEYDSGRVFEGDWVSGQWHGKGKLRNPNGDSYDGEFFFDARHGQGIYRWDNEDVYVGTFTSDRRHGIGKFSFHNGNVYSGEFCDGMFEGFGRYDFSGGSYEGDWKEGRYDGSGELLYATGGKYTGEFRNSVAHGFGLEVMPDGTKRRGVWVDGKPTDS